MIISTPSVLALVWDEPINVHDTAGCNAFAKAVSGGKLWLKSPGVVLGTSAAVVFVAALLMAGISSGRHGMAAGFSRGISENPIISGDHSRWVCSVIRYCTAAGSWNPFSGLLVHR